MGGSVGFEGDWGASKVQRKLVLIGGLMWLDKRGFLSGLEGETGTTADLLLPSIKDRNGMGESLPHVDTSPFHPNPFPSLGI